MDFFVVVVSCVFAFSAYLIGKYPLPDFMEWFWWGNIFTIGDCVVESQRSIEVPAPGKALWHSVYVAPSAEVSDSEDCRGSVLKWPKPWQGCWVLQWKRLLAAYLSLFLPWKILWLRDSLVSVCGLPCSGGVIVEVVVVVVAAWCLMHRSCVAVIGCSQSESMPRSGAMASPECQWLCCLRPRWSWSICGGRDWKACVHWTATDPGSMWIAHRGSGSCAWDMGVCGASVALESGEAAVCLGKGVAALVLGQQNINSFWVGHSSIFFFFFFSAASSYLEYQQLWWLLITSVAKATSASVEILVNAGILYCESCGKVMAVMGIVEILSGKVCSVLCRAVPWVLCGICWMLFITPTLLCS